MQKKLKKKSFAKKEISGKANIDADRHGLKKNKTTTKILAAINNISFSNTHFYSLSTCPR